MILSYMRVIANNEISPSVVHVGVLIYTLCVQVHMYMCTCEDYVGATTRVFIHHPHLLLFYFGGMGVSLNLELAELAILIG